MDKITSYLKIVSGLVDLTKTHEWIIFNIRNQDYRLVAPASSEVLVLVESSGRFLHGSDG